MKRDTDLTSGNIPAYLVSLAAPLVAGNILQEFYNTIDAFVVGRFAGKEEFAAIGIAGTAMNLFLFALVGCCNGFSILFAQACGQKNMKELRKQHFNALIAGACCVLFLMFAGLVCMNPLLTILQTPRELHNYVASYLYWIFLSLPAAFFYNLFAALLRSTGDTKASLYVLIISVVTNLFLDIFLVEKCQKGIEGAAVATAITQTISAALCFIYLWKKHGEMILHRRDCKSNVRDVLKSLQTGLITCLHQSSLYLGKLLVQGTVNTGGTDIIAAYTAATRIEGFANSIGTSGSTSTSILTAQNYGAGKKERVCKTFRYSFCMLAGMGLSAMLILFLFAPQTIALMLGNNSGTSYGEGIHYLRLVAVFYLFCYTGNTFTGYYNGVGKVIVPFIGATGHILVRVVLSWLLFPVMGLGSVALATGIGWMLANCFWGILYIFCKWQK